MSETPVNLIPRCSICGELMPVGEEMFKFHGYSGPCPKPPLERPKPTPGIPRSTLQALLAKEPVTPWIVCCPDCDHGVRGGSPCVLCSGRGTLEVIPRRLADDLAAILAAEPEPNDAAV